MNAKMKKGHTIKVHDHGFVTYLDKAGSDRSIVAAARVSYAAESKGAAKDRKLLGYLFRNRHTSPFEMAKLYFVIRMPIFVMRQYVRHRMQNLNEVSARYTELPEEFYVPEEWRVQSSTNKQSSESGTVDQGYCDNVAGELYRNAYDAYMLLIEQGVAREQARIVLPVGIYTEIRCCWDMNNLLKFFSLRDDAHAQAEIQDYARAMKEIARAAFPWTMDAYDRRDSK